MDMTIDEKADKIEDFFFKLISIAPSRGKLFTDPEEPKLDEYDGWDLYWKEKEFSLLIAVKEKEADFYMDNHKDVKVNGTIRIEPV